ncbi:hypothetical protein F5877DRAFT_69914 [Lentinula edodes]|nr:hypothetical protein F5877DRAFT_69914 [Lentinula edodes]
MSTDPHPVWSQWPPSQPSDTWMLSGGAWIDGARNPPVMYRSAEQIRTVYEFWLEHLPHLCPTFQAQHNQPPRPCPRPLPQPLPRPSLPPPIFYYNYFHFGFSLLPIPSESFFSASTVKMQTKSTSLTGKALVLSFNHAGFMKYCLSLHTLEDNFELQRPNGPAFTIYWTGSAGGKSNRLTIKDDDQYKNVQDELKKCNPNQKNFRVIVEFNLDSMISWETRKRRATDFTELNDGTKVPRLDGFSEEERLVGHFVNEINKKYPCTEHKGEHGNNGTCWKDADNQHVGLNNRMKKLWAEAIVSGNATIKEPPNIPGIESTCDGVPVQHLQRCKATQIPAVETAVTRIHIHVHVHIPNLTVDIIDIVLQLLHHLP